MEPGSILPETAHYQLSTDVFDDIIALEITEVSPDLVVLQLKEDSLEGCEGGAYKYEVDVGEQCPMFSLDTSKKDDSWRAPVGIPVEGLTDGQGGEYCGMVVNGTAEETDSTYSIPEACSGNLEIQFYPCEFCEASYTDEQELETHKKKQPSLKSKIRRLCSCSIPALNVGNCLTDK
ncbi:hypothetical protein GJAV_G00175110 [Gymnothorax javanicus]|nr:hypothetical protein GJAV_G00175110 [Gymnothorax javanicus]